MRRLRVVKCNRSENVLNKIAVKTGSTEITNKNLEDEAGTSSNNMDVDEICRICHAGISMGELLSPCKCKGSIANTHMCCLERWLKQSGSSYCELCQHHFQTIRKPKYSVPASIFLFLRHPGEHLKEILLDLLAFTVYTPSALTSTYILMLVCDRCTALKEKMTVSSHILVGTAILVYGLGIVAIDFTYSAWLTLCFQKHRVAWREWYRNQCELQVILPPTVDDKDSSNDDGNDE